MRIFLLLFVTIIYQSIAHEQKAGVNWFQGGGYSGISVVHQSFHETGATYLVCNTKSSVKDWVMYDGTIAGEELHIEATVVGVIKGPKKVGEKVNYMRLAKFGEQMGRFKNIKKYVGQLVYVQYDLEENGTYSNTPLGPGGAWNYSDMDARVVLESHRVHPNYDYSEFTIATLKEIEKSLLRSTDLKSADNETGKLSHYSEVLRYICVIIEKQTSSQLGLEKRKKHYPELLKLQQSILKELIRVKPWMEKIGSTRDYDDLLIVKAQNYAKVIPQNLKTIISYYKTK